MAEVDIVVTEMACLAENKARFHFSDTLHPDLGGLCVTVALAGDSDSEVNDALITATTEAVTYYSQKIVESAKTEKLNLKVGKGRHVFKGKTEDYGKGGGKE